MEGVKNKTRRTGTLIRCDSVTTLASGSSPLLGWGSAAFGCVGRWARPVRPLPRRK
jgi:hypothetical protein